VRKPVLRVQDLSVTFTSQAGSFLRRRERQLRAVDGISFDLEAGETLGVVGESGSGKSTLARAILGLIRPGRGRVMWRGEELTGLDEEQMRQKRKELQIVFQDPVASLNPRMTAGDIIAEPLWTFYPNMERLQVEERTRGMMKVVLFAVMLVAAFLIYATLHMMVMQKVKDIGGKAPSGVTADLDYLVIGDDGSPLLGAGNKSSKHKKADKLVDGGADLKIISETDFLKMVG